MGRLCGGAHEISGNKAAPFLCGGWLEGCWGGWWWAGGWVGGVGGVGGEGWGWVGQGQIQGGPQGPSPP